MKKQLEIDESIESTIKKIQERYKELGIKKTEDQIRISALKLLLKEIMKYSYLNNKS